MPRLQFSLRALLISMAIIGAGIVVYRWSWTETTVTKGETVTTQYRRGWTGKALKHGLQRMTNQGSPIVEERWYEDGDLRRLRMFQDGVVFIDQSFRNGPLDGPYLGVGSSATSRGTFRQGRKHGTWTITWPEVVEEEVWRNGERHGPRKWTTPHGRVLQTAEYADGRLTHWNGQPLEDEFRRWLAAAVPDSELRQKLLATIAKPPSADVTLHYGELLYHVGDPPQPLVVQWDHQYPETEIPFRGRPIGEAILEEALEYSHTLSYRYGMLHVVPISARELDWQDRTGVYDIQFPAGSDQEKFWLSPAARHYRGSSHPVARIQRLFAPEHDSPIEVDATAVAHLAPILTAPTDPNRMPTFPRIRRDLVGQYLNQAGYYCELREGKLAILPFLVTPQRKAGSGVDESRPE